MSQHHRPVSNLPFFKVQQRDKEIEKKNEKTKLVKINIDLEMKRLKDVNAKLNKQLMEVGALERIKVDAEMKRIKDENEKLKRELMECKEEILKLSLAAQIE